jgi:transcriptional regulator NrdR family protein
MVCAYCGSSTKIVNSRHLKRINGTWRRRVCNKCQAIFTTNEVAQYDALWSIKNARGILSQFERDKLFISIYDSCKHRKAARSEASDLTNTVINALIKIADDGLIAKSDLMMITYGVLDRFDKVAAIHYQAYNEL